jgi:hypothetical protein
MLLQLLKINKKKKNILIHKGDGKRFKENIKNLIFVSNKTADRVYNRRQGLDKEIYNRC